MTTLAELFVKISGDASGFDKTASDAMSKAKNLGKGMTSIGKKATVGLTLPILGIGVAAVSAGSDLEESLSKVQVVFGETAGIVTAFADTSAESFGLARADALEAIGTFGNLFSAMGVGQDVTADMSTNLVALSADLASFNNLSPEEVLLKLQSGLTGQAMPLRSLGVNLSAAATEAKAFELGLQDSNDELSEAALVQARYAIILEQTTLAQGDFERTSEGMANQSRILKAQLADLAAGIGQDLLPIALQLVGGVRNIITWFQNLSPATRKTILIVAGLVAVVGPLLIILGSIIGALGTILPLFAALLSPVGLIIVAIVALSVAIFVFRDDIRDGLTAAWNFITDIVGKVIGKFTELWNNITSINWLQLGKNVLDGIVSGIKNGLASLGNAVADVGGTLIDGIADFLKIGSPSKLAFDMLGMPVGEGMVGGAVSGVKSGLAGADIGGALGGAVPAGGGSAFPGARNANPAQQAAGGDEGRKIEIIVNNPVAEPASETIPRELTKLAFLGVLK